MGNKLNAKRETAVTAVSQSFNLQIPQSVIYGNTKLEADKESSKHVYVTVTATHKMLSVTNLKKLLDFIFNKCL